MYIHIFFSSLLLFYWNKPTHFPSDSQKPGKELGLVSGSPLPAVSWTLLLVIVWRSSSQL